MALASETDWADIEPSLQTQLDTATSRLRGVEAELSHARNELDSAKHVVREITAIRFVSKDLYHLGLIFVIFSLALATRQLVGTASPAEMFAGFAASTMACFLGFVLIAHKINKLAHGDDVPKRYTDNLFMPIAAAVAVYLIALHTY